MRAHHMYEYAPARYPVARPEPAQRTAGALCLSTSTARAPALGMGCECSKDPFGSRSTPHYYHSKRLSTTTPSGFFQISTEFLTHCSISTYQSMWTITHSKNNINKYTASNGSKTVHFGAKGYQDFTTHRDKTRRASYLARHGSGGQNWSDPIGGTIGHWLSW
eukprot:scaffold9810_cov134-Isochrysis_galbana.AAC.2